MCVYRYDGIDMKNARIGVLDLWIRLIGYLTTSLCINHSVMYLVVDRIRRFQARYPN